MFEQVFRNVDDILRREAGCTTELDYTEQTSWVLFLKYLEALEEDRATVAALHGRKYSHILEKAYRWETWAAPKGKDGKLDHNKALTGPDLAEFVAHKLFPYLQGFRQRASGPNTIEYKIGEIFAEIKNKVHSGNSKQQAFLDFVLAQYVQIGVQELEQEKLAPLLKLKYRDAMADAVADLGKPEAIGTMFSGFQKYLYQPPA